MEHRTFVLICCFQMMSVILFAQNQIPVGSWRTHLSFNNVLAMTADHQNIYCASSSGIFYVNIDDNSISKLTKIDGLSDSGITALGYNDNLSIVVVAYSNGNIDFIADKEIINFSELLNSTISGSKQINHIASNGDLVYLSTDFGMLIIDLKQMVVTETLFELGVNGEKIIIHGSTILGDSLLLASEQGVLAGNLTDNLKDFKVWKHFSTADGLPVSMANSISTDGTNVIAGIGTNGLFQYQNGKWVDTGFLQGKNIPAIHFNGNGFDVTTATGIYDFSNGSVSNITSTLSSSAVDFKTVDSKIWIADNVNGLIKIEGSSEESIYPNGPFTNDIVKLYYTNNQLVALPAAYDINFAPLRSSKGFFIFENGEWINYNSTSYPKTVLIPEFLDITGVVFLPADNSLNLSSFGYGILKLTDGQSTIIDENTSASPLQNVNPPDRNVLISGITANTFGLWMINFNTNDPLHNLTANSNWKSFSPSINSKYGLQILPTSWDHLWITAASTFGGGITVFDGFSNSKLLTTVQGSGGLPDSKILDIALDLEEKMWVATQNGVVYYPFPRFIFDETAIDPVLPIFDFSPLFRNEEVTALAIDGGNRIWMGTKNGVWLFDNDGSSLMNHFTASNSPLLSDDIHDIVINHISGEVFFATDKGLISYRGHATIKNPEDGLKIFPNPVEPGYGGYITIEGVPSNALITITDASGRRVFNTTANGNTATWLGVDSNGQQVASGVYYVFVSTTEGEQKRAGKIAIIR